MKIETNPIVRREAFRAWVGPVREHLELEDLLQVGRWAAYRADQDFDGRGNKSGYISRRVQWALVDEIRAVMPGGQWRWQQRNDRPMLRMVPLERACRVASPEQRWIDPLVWPRVRKAVSGLPPLHRRVLWASCEDGRYYRNDLARRLRISGPRFKQVRAQALKQVRQALGVAA